MRRTQSLMDSVSLQDSGCWNWTRSKRAGRYGNVQWKGKVQAAHRVFANVFLGFPLDKRNVMHKCDNPLCCNPAHLFIGTQKDNMMDCAKKGRMRESKKTHCKNGHPFDSQNTYFWKGDTKRRCRVCRKLRHKKWMES